MEDDMADHFGTCPQCSNKIMMGAMRCGKCGNLLKTAEEQAASMKKLREANKKSPLAGFIKLLAFLLVAGVVYHYFSDYITSFCLSILDTLKT
jgi:DNA-directed RNA polymerase subunit RPC12/RpoP